MIILTPSWQELDKKIDTLKYRAGAESQLAQSSIKTVDNVKQHVICKSSLQCQSRVWLHEIVV